MTNRHQTFFLVNNRWRETERRKLQTKLSYLKARINPHFLFSTLNSIYSLAIVESPPPADAIVKLSSFLRYVIQDSQQDSFQRGTRDSDWHPLRSQFPGPLQIKISPTQSVYLPINWLSVQRSGLFLR